MRKELYLAASGIDQVMSLFGTLMKPKSHKKKPDFLDEPKNY
jgi:hypothetical protein